jgi:hypothetical protein
MRRKEDYDRLTRELRATLDERGIRYETGYRMPHGVRVDRATVTTVWPVEGDVMATLTFEEEDGALFCVDSVSVAQAVNAAMGVTL